MQKSFLPWILLASLIVCCIEVDISVPGFVAIGEYFQVTDSKVQLILAYHFIGFALASLIWGPLADSYGYRKIMIIGNGILMLGAVGCVLAPSMTWMLSARVIQGMGAASSAVIAFAIIKELFAEKEAQHWIAIFNAIITLLIAIAPLIGGVINQWIGWRGNYALIALLSIAAWVLIWWKLPNVPLQQQPLSATKLYQHSKTFLTHSPFLRASIIPSLLYSAYLVFVGASSFIYMKIFGLSLGMYIVHQSVIVGAFAMTSLCCHKIIATLGNPRGMILGMVLCLASQSILTLCCYLNWVTPVILTSLMVIFNMGFAICYPIIFSQSLDFFPDRKGLASSLIMSKRAFLNFICLYLGSACYNGECLNMAIVLFGIVLCAGLCSLNPSTLLCDKGA
jgi:DHA1 family bicyclomycin/chloramphenicol resistance-like MFS transporter